MQALISRLPKPYEAQVLDLWKELKEKFGLKYIWTTTIPHFTWQMGESYQLQAITPILEKRAAELEPFEISVEGVESFIGQTPVAFLKIIKSPALIKLHSQLWQDLLPFAREPNLLYSPSLWRPHITLALQDLSWEQLKPVLDYLMALKINWHITIDQFSILTQTADNAMILERDFQFGKGSV